jgi:dodecin
MAVGKIIELTSASPKSFEDAIITGIERARETVDEIKGVWIKDQKIAMKKGQIHEFRVDMKVTFLLRDTK